MRRNGEFILREVAGEILVIPAGEAALQLNGMIVLNPVSKVIWKCLEKGATEAEIVTAVTDLFDVDTQEARNDITEFLDQMRKQGLLREDEAER